MKARVGIVLLATLVLFATSATAQLVQTELMLLCDVSGSISQTEFNLQKEGYVNAFTSSAVQNLIDQASGGIAATLLYWSGWDEQVVAVDWTHLTDATSCNDFANDIDTYMRPYGGLTAPGSAINFGNPLFWDNGFTGGNQVMDVSGDGIENEGDSTAAARDAALLAGVDRINGLAIQSSVVFDWYVDNVQGGTDSFTLMADDFEDFAAAIEQKILREVNPIPEPGTLSLIGLGMLGVVVARMRRRR